MRLIYQRYIHIQMASITRRIEDGTHPFDPSKTNIPVLGMSKLRFVTAAISPFEENLEVLYTFVKLRIDIAVFSGTVGISSDIFFFQKAQELDLCPGTEFFAS